MENFNKLKIVNVKDIDKSNVFIAVDSNSWRIPNKITIQDLINNVPVSVVEPSIRIIHAEPSIITIHHDTSILIIQREVSILMVQAPMPEIKYVAPSVFSEPFINQDIDIHVPPKNASELSAMHMMTDENYLYVWVANRWKRTLLSTW